MEIKKTVLPEQEITPEVLREKYCKGGESTVEDVRRRVARALAMGEKFPDEWEDRFYAAMLAGFIPGGMNFRRIFTRI